MDSINYLFAVEAEQLLLAGMPEDAVELCKRGLEKYPNYSAALSILIKAYKSLGQIEIANQFLLDYKNNITATTLKYLLKILADNNENDYDNFQDIVSISESKINDENIYNNAFLDDFRKILEQRDFSANIDLIPGLTRFRKDINPFGMVNRALDISQIENLITQQTNLNSIIQSISKAEDIKVEKTPKNERTDKVAKSITATDTIANILVIQGAYSEAKNAYKELLIKYPEKKNFYEEKINEIESILDSKGAKNE